ncbi:MAG: acyltransferase family protein [Aeromicrobium sp.]|uniref:acyltransferase family protein n=1 Tax=Aeromicrobium sp. TaxID=1871063 RepID=UPI0039E4366A
MRRIEEVHGLRGVALLLVVTFHLFANGRVSGGVDVFLVISGFVLTAGLVRRAEGDGIDLPAQYRRSFSRLAPSAVVVALATVVVGQALLTRTAFAQALNEAIASVLYVENFALITSQLDYEAAGADTSPFQHFWSLSAQGQFIFAWPAAVVLIWACARRAGRDGRRAATVVTASLLVASAAAAVAMVRADQPVAYFHTAARLWEILAGALLALTAPVIADRAKAVLGWAGLGLIVSCGLMLDGASLFPGVAALWPVAGALLVLVGAGSTARRSPRALLEWAPLKRVADLSYELYLWHWPFMVYYLAATGRSSLGAADAALVLAGSLALAWLTRRLVSSVTAAPRQVALVAAAVVVLVTSSAVARDEVLHRIDDQFVALKTPVESLHISYPRDRTPTPGIGLDDLAPSLDIVTSDLPETSTRGCYSEVGDPEVDFCELNAPETPSLTVALVGASHDYQFDPTLLYLAERHNWRLVTIAKPSCRLGDSRQRDADCVAWNARLPTTLAAMRPDVVFTLGTFTRKSGVDVLNEGTYAALEHIVSLGATVVTLRDNPRFETAPADCLAATRTVDAPECVRLRSEVYAPVSPGLAAPPGVVHLDTADLFCGPEVCPVVTGRVLMYRDSHHLTATYARTLGPELEDMLRQAAPQLLTPPA